MLKNHPVSLYITWLVIILIVPLPLVILLNTGLSDSIQHLIIYDAGIVAYVWWLSIVLLSTRPQWLEWRIGLPAMYFVHGLLGVLALGLATYHVLNAFSMDQLIKNTGHFAWYLAIFGVLYASFFLSGWLVDRFPIAASLKRKLQFIFKHQLSLWIHRLNFVVIGLIWLHVHLIGRVSQITDFIILFDVYTIVNLGLYAWKKFVASSAERLNGQLIDNTELNQHVRQVKIKLGRKAPKYQAGDFYFLSFQHVTGLTNESHPFSVTTAPISSPNIITFTIQNTGDFTSQLSSIPTGSDVKLEGPFGRFAPLIENANPKIPLILIGMGTGIAPLLSLTQQYASSRKIHVLWSVHEASDFYYQQAFDSLESLITFDQHITRFTTLDYQNKLTEQELTSALFFIVGPANGVLSTEKVLRHLGVSANQLIDERLTM
ncbi:FAD-binding oxidoreductase [Pediococcus inopinatus]|uniref:FAD-binding oxidoreductase n=1 Tax=Pediococcus TaxID=1253 RepID=UPI0007C47CA1|nr:FAD-binding oxidoreductase [Pediococcus inopinatus]WPC19145.1 FAD-binding oxidoreductase [Pediococcus inopinatus]